MDENNKEKSFWQLMGEYAKFGIEYRLDSIKGIWTETKEFASLFGKAAKITLREKVENLRNKAEEDLDKKHKEG